MSNSWDQFRQQWSQPSDILSILMILGGDIVARALAQLAGAGLAPVAFSFGWVAYSVSAVVSAIGDGRLMPATPDYPCKVINGNSGYSVDNSSWVLGRIMRDFHVWSDEATTQMVSDLLEAKWTELKQSDPDVGKPAQARTGLVVSIFRPSRNRRGGIPRRDLLYWSGLGTILVQLGIATIPIATRSDWTILVLTVGGTALAILTSLLPQWKEEKWACRTQSNDSYVVTGGNGSQHAIVVLANGHGLNLEDLAAGHRNMDMTTQKFTRVSVVVVSVLWMCLLISAAGIVENTWYMLAVGTVGILHNIAVAGAARRPENHGIHLDFVEVIGATKVMKTLLAVEQKYPRLGRSMLGEFFPGRLRKDEIQLWDSLQHREASDSQPSLSTATTLSVSSGLK